MVILHHVKLTIMTNHHRENHGSCSWEAEGGSSRQEGSPCAAGLQRGDLAGLGDGGAVGTQTEDGGEKEMWRLGVLEGFCRNAKCFPQKAPDNSKLPVSQVS